MSKKILEQFLIQPTLLFFWEKQPFAPNKTKDGKIKTRIVLIYGH